MVKTGIEPIDHAMHWLCENTHHTLDFGCGSGMLLLMSSMFGQRKVEGIDISPKSIYYARKLFTHASKDATFHIGSGDVLKTLKKETYDSVILSNILDNLLPEDTLDVLLSIVRLLKDRGKVFVKLNDYASPDDVKKFKVVANHTYLEPSGLYLLNLPTDVWNSVFRAVFDVIKVERFYIERAKQYNRLFLLTRKSSVDEDALIRNFNACINGNK